MRKVILDTDMLCEYWKGRDRAVEGHAAAYLQAHWMFTFTSVSAYEIVQGFRAKGAESQLCLALSWLQRNEEIEPTGADYRWAASTMASAKKLGLAGGLTTCLKAAVAVRLELPIVTGTALTYEPILKTGAPLELQDWRTPAPRITKS
jgi:predicted nucleic acid-binding protein